jgi:hypothetical protein
MHLGMTSVAELPEFTKLVEHIKLPQTPGLNQQPLSFQTAPQAPAGPEAVPAQTAEPQAEESAVLKDVDSNGGKKDADGEEDDE